MTRWLLALFGISEPPHRQEVRDRFKALPAIPESDRMKQQPQVSRKPKSIEEWKRRHTA